MFRIGGNTFYNQKNKFPMKILEFKRSGIRLIAEFSGIPNRFSNQVLQQQGHSRSSQYHHDHHQSNNERQGQDVNDDIINAMGGGRGDDSSWRVNKNGVTGKNVVLFNDRQVEDGEVPSNKDDLGRNNKTSNDDDNGGSAGDDRDGKGDNGRKVEWEEDNSRRSNGKNEFELDNNDGAEEGGEGWRDNHEDRIDKDDDDYDVRWESGPTKRRRAATLMTLVEDHALDDDDL